MAVLIQGVQPDFSVRYSALDETVFFDPFVIRLSVIDHLGGQADEAEMTLENREGTFSTQYFPARGDDVELSIGWKGGDLPGLWDFGRFTIDEAQLMGPPDQLVIRALSTSVKTELRTQRSRAFENTTLAEIVDKVAQGLGLQSAIPDLRLDFTRVTQHRETDLAFLDRLARAHGCILKVKGTTLVVATLASLLDKDSGVGIGRENVIRYTIRSKTAETFRAAVSRYWNPATRDQVQFLTTPARMGTVSGHPVPANTTKRGPVRQVLGSPAKVDVAKVFERVETAAQAQARQDAALLTAAIGNVVGTLEVLGDPRIRAGGTVFLYPEDWGQLGGWYVVQRVRHTLARSGGFVSEVDIAHNPAPPRSQPKRTKPGAPPPKLGKGAR